MVIHALHCQVKIQTQTGEVFLTFNSEMSQRCENVACLLVCALKVALL